MSLGQLLQHAYRAFTRGDDGEAARACRAVLEARPRTFEAVVLLGMLAHRAGQLAEAIGHLEAAVQVQPGHAEALFNLGALLAEQGRWPDALARYEQAIRHQPGMAPAHFNRAELLGRMGRTAEAVAGYRQAVVAAPQDEAAHFNLGTLLIARAQYADALGAFEQALALRPGYAGALDGCGMALWGLGRHEQALQSLDAALRLDPSLAETWSRRAMVLLDLDRAAPALDSCERALELAPDLADAHYNRGNALRALHRFPDAITSFERALALDPSHADAHINLADVLLMMGRFETGWPAYAWRWHGGRNARPDLPGRPWSGDRSALAGRVIVLHSELGLGDTIQFSRYSKILSALGAQPILEVQAPLVPLLQTWLGADRVVARGGPLPAADLHCPLMRLPQLFDTRFDTLPAQVPYLRADAERSAALRERLGPRSRPRIGVVWRGSEALVNDKRSMALAELLPLLDRHPQLHWFSLQKEVHPADRDLLAARPDLHWLRDDCADFVGTAALVDQLDLVITVDTSIAHLAGALARPVWVLLPHTPQDWRWFIDRDDSPWYPTARLFRQPAPRAWAPVLAHVADELGRASAAAAWGPV